MESERYETSNQIAQNVEYNSMIEDLLEEEIQQAIDEGRVDPAEKWQIIADFRKMYVYPDDILIRKKNE